MHWVLSDEAQNETINVHFAPIPAKLRENALAALHTITYDGKPIEKSGNGDRADQ